MKAPAPIDADPDFRAARERLAMLRAAVEAEQEVERGLTTALIAGDEDQPSGAVLIDRAHRVASGESVASPTLDSLRAKLAASREKQGILLAGVAAQRTALVGIHGQLSHAACASARQDHAAAVKRIADCVRALDAANRAEIAVREGLEGAGYASGELPPMFHAPAGFIDDPHSAVRPFAAQCDRYVMKHGGNLPAKLLVHALVSLPGLKLAAGEVGSIDAVHALALADDGSVELASS